MTVASDDMHLAIRTMSPADLEVSLDWAAAEGWNPGLHDAECFRAADLNGFLMLCEDGAPVGSISAVRYPGFGFIGLYIVRPDRRGRGFGRRLWAEGLQRLAGRLAGLDGVVARQPDYARAGFATAHRNIRFSGTPRGAGAIDPRIAPIDDARLPAVLAHDRRFFPAEREAFLRCWLRRPGRTARALVADGAVAGYGVLRACRVGHKIGPLFARDADAARALLDALLREVDGPVALDVPEPNRAGVALAESLGLAAVFETARMYRGAPPSLPLSEIFGITTFELG